MIYLVLMFSFLYIGLFSIGGGYATMPLIQEQVVERHHWLTMEEFADVIAISQMTPGPIAINSATFTGIRIAGIFGAIAATIGCILPSLVIVLSLAFLYYRYQGLSIVQGILNGLKPAVIAMIASSGLSLAILAFWNGGQPSVDPEALDWPAVLFFAAALFILRRRKKDPILIMAGCGAAGLIMYSLIG